MGIFVIGMLIGSIGGICVTATMFYIMERRKIGASSVLLNRTSMTGESPIKVAHRTIDDALDEDGVDFIDELICMKYYNASVKSDQI